MKNVYRVGDDLFIAAAFVSFIVGIILKLMGISDIWLGITPKGILFFSMMCLLFSIALSLYDLNQKKS
ncbi:MAG: hypothetical protein DRP76_01380 [Candidatus Omnitrophota bacterium]|nr:MAG: hypothetical protein DRP76_01380 [Candidatus Omnitrophota bacterium]